MKNIEELNIKENITITKKIFINHIKKDRKKFHLMSSERWSEFLTGDEEIARELLDGNPVFIAEDPVLLIPTMDLKFRNETDEWFLVEWEKCKGLDPENKEVVLMGNVDLKTFTKR